MLGEYWGWPRIGVLYLFVYHRMDIKWEYQLGFVGSTQPHIWFPCLESSHHVLLFCLSYEWLQVMSQLLCLPLHPGISMSFIGSLNVTLQLYVLSWHSQSVSLPHLFAYVWQLFEKDNFIFASYQQNNSSSLFYWTLGVRVTLYLLSTSYFPLVCLACSTCICQSEMIITLHKIIACYCLVQLPMFQRQRDATDCCIEGATRSFVVSVLCSNDTNLVSAAAHGTAFCSPANIREIQPTSAES